MTNTNVPKRPYDPREAFGPNRPRTNGLNRAERAAVLAKFFSDLNMEPPYSNLTVTGRLKPLQIRM